MTAEHRDPLAALPTGVAPAPRLALLLRGPEPRPAAQLARRALLVRRVRWFVAATITYNIVEAVVAVAAGTRASSSALLSFGLDSLIEVGSAAAVAWQFSAADPDVREAREHRALRVIAASFFALAAYVAADAGRGLIGGRRAHESVVGIVLAAVSLVVMPVLSAGQRRTGRRLGSASAVADSHQTQLCTYLSAVLLVGLVLNATVGWWWADPLAAAAVAVVALREGRQAWRGDGCCAPATQPTGGDPRVPGVLVPTAGAHHCSSREPCGCC